MLIPQEAQFWDTLLTLRQNGQTCSCAPVKLNKDPKIQPARTEDTSGKARCRAPAYHGAQTDCPTQPHSHHLHVLHGWRWFVPRTLPRLEPKECSGEADTINGDIGEELQAMLVPVSSLTSSSSDTSGTAGGRFGWFEAGVCEAGSGCDSGG